MCQHEVSGTNPVKFRGLCASCDALISSAVLDIKNERRQTTALHEFDLYSNLDHWDDRQRLPYSIPKHQAHEA